MVNGGLENFLQEKRGDTFEDISVENSCESKIKKLNGKENIFIKAQHRLNPMHLIFCNLQNRGYGKTFSLNCARGYEIFVYSWVAPLTILGYKCSKLFD